MTDERVAFLSPKAMGLGITPGGKISLRLGRPDPSPGLDPEISLAAELTPDQARQLATALVRKADEAEGAAKPRLLC